MDDDERRGRDGIRALLTEEFPALESRFQAVLDAPAAQESDLRIDDDRSFPYRVRDVVLAALQLAYDSLRATRDVVLVGGEPHPPVVAHYALIRSAIEGAVQATWVLRPDRSEERIGRALACHAEDEGHESTLFEAQLERLLQRTSALPTEAERRESMRRIQDLKNSREQSFANMRKAQREIADRCGPGPGQPLPKKPGFRALAELADDGSLTSVRTAKISWLTLSAMAHPSAARATQYSQHAVHDFGDGSVRVATFASFRETLDFLTTAHELFAASVELLAARKGLHAEAVRSSTARSQ
ncbi:hypothetical protein [Microbacterium paludicola]|uniref:hypothetical protein n=1 Tax=Microbacterium paludicola TaxID=300019 RepID=UPI0031D5A913